MDFYFFGTRILLHRRNTTGGLTTKIICGASLILITVDLIEIIFISLRIKNKISILNNLEGEKSAIQQTILNQQKVDHQKHDNKNWKEPLSRDKNKSSEDSNVRVKPIRPNKNKTFARNLGQIFGQRSRYSSKSRRRGWNNRRINKSTPLERKWRAREESSQNSSLIKMELCQESHLSLPQRSSATKIVTEADLLKDYEIDHEKTLSLNSFNQDVDKFARKMLVEKEEAFSSAIFKINNILNVLHLSIYQIAIPALPYSPFVVLAVLNLTEIGFILATIVPYFLKFRFIPLLELTSKTVRFICMEGFLLICLRIISSSSSRKEPLPVNKDIQLWGIYFLLGGMISTYLFTLIKVIVMIMELIKKFKNEKKNHAIGSSHQKFIIKGLIVYARKDYSEVQERVSPSSIASKFHQEAPIDLSREKILEEKNPFKFSEESEADDDSHKKIEGEKSLSMKKKNNSDFGFNFQSNQTSLYVEDQHFQDKKNKISQRAEGRQKSSNEFKNSEKKTEKERKGYSNKTLNRRAQSKNLRALNALTILKEEEDYKDPDLFKGKPKRIERLFYF